MRFVLLIVGIFLLSFSVTVKYKYQKDLRRHELLHAVVEENLCKTMEGGKVRYYPVLRFTFHEQEFCREYGFGSKKSKYTTGQQVNILLDASSKIFYIEGDMIENTIFGWSLLFGILCLVGSVLLWWLGL